MDYNEIFITNVMNQTVFVVGKNASDNWKIYKQASQTSTIFHLDKLTSPYVIVGKPIDELTNEEIIIAATMCKEKSKHRYLSNLKVMYTSISNTKLADTLGTFTVLSNHKKKIVII